MHNVWAVIEWVLNTLIFLLAGLIIGNRTLQNVEAIDWLVLVIIICCIILIIIIKGLFGCSLYCFNGYSSFDNNHVFSFDK